MHKWCKEIAECVKAKVIGIGYDNMTPADINELKCWSEIVSNFAKADYHIKIVEEMEKPENVYGENYNENGRMFYGGSHIGGGRKYYNRMNEMYDMNRDMDRDSYGRMYYSESGSNKMGGMSSGSGSMNRNAGRSANSRMRYYTTKEEHPTNDVNDKQVKMKEAEHYFDDLDEDVKEMVKGESQEMKTLARNRLMAMANSLA